MSHNHRAFLRAKRYILNLRNFEFPLSHSPMTRNEFAGSFKPIISVSDMRRPILPIDCRGCGRDRLLLSLTRTITIDLVNTGLFSTSMNMEQGCISIAMLVAFRSKIPLTTSTKLHYRIAGIRQRYKEYFLKLDNTAMYILYIMATILVSFLISVYL